MSLTSDQLRDTSRLSVTAKVLLALQPEIEVIWEKEVRARVPYAADLPHPLLIDTLPAFIANLAEALTPGYPRADAGELSSLAQEHGGERARLTNYNPSHIAREYHILREIIFAALNEKAESPLTPDEARTIQESFDTAVCDAITGFALVQANLREQFIATLTHDLRNPIGVISMAAELLPDELDNKRDALSLIERIKENAKRADQLILDLLDVTLINSRGRLDLEFTETNIENVVRESVTSQSLIHGKRFEVRCESIKGFWDARSLRRVLDNLITNAVKYGDPVAPIRIQASSGHERLMLSVHNEGTPIPPEEREAIFQAFRRAKRAREGKKKGWGLGLSLVRGVAESHGGSIIVDSAEGRGTTFSIDIPVDARPFAQAPILRS